MSIITYAGRSAIAEAILKQPIHLAIGDGGGDWGESPPQLDYDATALMREIGRKALHRGFFVYPDVDGEFVLPGDRKFTASLTPTRHLYLQFLFDYNEGIEAYVREIGIFIGTTVKPGLPGTQTFFTPDDIEKPGTLLFLNYPKDPEKYNPTKRGGYEQVLSF